MIGSWSAPPISPWTIVSSCVRSRSYAMRTARRRPPSAGDAQSSSSPAGSIASSSRARSCGSGLMERPSSCSSGGRSSRSASAEATRGDQRLQDLRAAPSPPGARRARARRTTVAMSCAPPTPTSGPARQDVARLVGLVEPAPDDERLGRRLERLGQPARRAERGQPGQPLADQRKLEQQLAPRVGHRRR